MSDLIPANKAPPTITEKLYDKLEQLVDEILILRVTTVVGPIIAHNATDLGTATTIAFGPGDQLVAQSAINTALGDMTLAFSSGFLENPVLAAMHNQAVIDGRAIRKETIDMMKSVLDMLRSEA